MNSIFLTFYFTIILNSLCWASQEPPAKRPRIRSSFDARVEYEEAFFRYQESPETITKPIHPFIDNTWNQETDKIELYHIEYYKLSANYVEAYITKSTDINYLLQQMKDLCLLEKKYLHLNLKFDAKETKKLLLNYIDLFCERFITFKQTKKIRLLQQTLEDLILDEQSTTFYIHEFKYFLNFDLASIFIKHLGNVCSSQEIKKDLVYYKALLTFTKMNFSKTGSFFQNRQNLLKLLKIYHVLQKTYPQESTCTSVETLKGNINRLALVYGAQNSLPKNLHSKHHRLHILEERDFIHKGTKYESSSRLKSLSVKAQLNPLINEHFSIVSSESRPFAPSEDLRLVKIQTEAFSQNFQSTLSIIRKGMALKSQQTIYDLDFESPISFGTYSAIQTSTAIIHNEVSLLMTNPHIFSSFLAIRPPGHHASSIESQSPHSHGFCFQNNAFLALHAAKKMSPSLTTLIIDWDLHYGDGTAQHLVNSRDENTFLLNIFGAEDFPLQHHRLDSFYSLEDKIDNERMIEISSDEKTRNVAIKVGLKATNVVDIDLGIEEDVTPSIYLKSFLLGLEEIRKKLGPKNPELIIISAGFDGHKNDASHFIKGFQLESLTYKQLSILIEKNFPESKKLYLLEGGYSKSLQDGILMTLEGSIK